MDDQKPEHKEHTHCIDCGECMEIPLVLLIDSVLEARDDDEPLLGFMCEVCLSKAV